MSCRGGLERAQLSASRPSTRNSPPTGFWFWSGWRGFRLAKLLPSRHAGLREARLRPGIRHIANPSDVARPRAEAELFCRPLSSFVDEGGSSKDTCRRGPCCNVVQRARAKRQPRGKVTLASRLTDPFTEPPRGGR
jgi:hypothetical protein